MNDFPNSSGIYELFCSSNGRSYIGQAVDLRLRLSVHLSTLRNGKHRNPHLQRAFDLYGETSFEFRVLELCSREELTSKECAHLENFRGREFNVAQPGPTPMLGRKMSPETKAKIKAAKVKSGSLKLVTIDGVTKSAKQHAADRGLSASVVSYRRRNGMSVELAISTPLKKAETFEAFGTRATLSVLCASSGVDTEVARQRIKMGWTVEQAVSTPTRRAFAA